MNKNPKVCIIGGGISGISVARMLNSEGIDCSVFEKNEVAGGLVSCTYEEHNLFHRVGGHVFNTKNTKVMKWFEKYFDVCQEFTKANRNAAIFTKNHLISYPIELSIRQLDQDLASKCIEELVHAANANYSDEKPQTNEYDNFEDFLLRNFGRTLYEEYFRPYNEKIWKTELKNIPLNWLSGKLPMISPMEIIKMNIFGGIDNMVHSTFFYPIEGGSQFIVDRLSDGLNIVNQEVKSLEKTGRSFIVNSNTDLLFDLVIYTGDLRELPGLCTGLHEASHGADFNLKDCLDANGTTTMLCSCDANEYSWIYLPDDQLKPHRMIMTGNFSESNNSPYLPLGRITCTVEYAGRLSEYEFRQELTNLPFAPKHIAYNYCENSYIVHRKDTQKLIDATKELLLESRIILHGRFAEWEYYNMDAAIESSFDVVELAKAIL